MQLVTEVEATMTRKSESAPEVVGRPVPAATLELFDSSDRSGSACAVLTPAIKAKLLELEPGQILLVRVDDPSAGLDVPAWCSLTGNVLQAKAEEENGILEFFIRKESKR
jgi:tRNA 2-thiouridine synthesizing protein A